MYIIKIDYIFDVRSDIAVEVLPSFWERMKGIFRTREKKFNFCLDIKATGDFGSLTQGDVVHVNHNLVLICSRIREWGKAEFRAKVTSPVPIDTAPFYKMKGEYPIVANAFFEK